jgi:nicotinamide riboside transporter PnuC
MVLELSLAHSAVLPLGLLGGDAPAAGDLLRVALLLCALITLAAAAASSLVVRERREFWMLVAMGCVAISLLLPLPGGR